MGIGREESDDEDIYMPMVGSGSGSGSYVESDYEIEGHAFRIYALPHVFECFIIIREML